MGPASRFSTFKVNLTDDLTVARLPIGDAFGMWWVPFAVSGRSLLMGPKKDDPHWLATLLRGVTFESPSGPMTPLGRSLGGDDRVQSGLWQFERGSEPFLRISYRLGNDLLDIETVSLTD